MNDLIVMSFQTDIEMRDMLKQLAKSKDMSVSAIIRQAIKEYSQKEDKSERS